MCEIQCINNALLYTLAAWSIYVGFECVKLTWDSQLVLLILPNHNQYFTVLLLRNKLDTKIHTSNSKPTSYTCRI